jgi:hypothetical protein
VVGLTWAQTSAAVAVPCRALGSRQGQMRCAAGAGQVAARLLRWWGPSSCAAGAGQVSACLLHWRVPLSCAAGVGQVAACLLRWWMRAPHLGAPMPAVPAARHWVGRHLWRGSSIACCCGRCLQTSCHHQRAAPATAAAGVARMHLKKDELTHGCGGRREWPAW